MGKAKGNATKAAIGAGYSKKTAASIASRLLRKVKVKDALQQRVQADPVVGTRRDRQLLWTAAMNNSKVDWKNRLRASELLGRSQGDFIKDIIPPHRLSDDTLRRIREDLKRGGDEIVE